MKKCTRKVMSLLLVILIISNLAGIAINADQSADFSIYLASNQSVMATYNSLNKTISITGTGAIEFDKWVALAKAIDSTNYPVKNSYTDKGGWRSTTTNMVISFDSGKIALCDSQNYSGLFENFKGEIRFNGNVERSHVRNASCLFKGADINNIDFTASTSGAIVATANNFLTGATPETVKFDKLAAFSWVLPNSYEIIEGKNGKQTTRTEAAGATINFVADIPYQLTKIVPQQKNNALQSNDFTMQLATGVAGDNVTAYYSDSDKKLTISGKGQIKYNKWKEMAKRFGADNFNGASGNYSYGWASAEDFYISFETAQGEKIQLCDGDNYNGLFEKFTGEIKFNHNVDTINVTKMDRMFKGAVKFNDDITDWHTTNVVSMTKMFSGANFFNQDIKYDANHDYWNTSNVTNMNYMFYRAVRFNGEIGNWQTNSLQDINHMFCNASKFSQNINNWQVENLKDMSYAFQLAKKFNSPLNKWNTAQVTDMAGAFEGATSFNQDISNLNTNNTDDLRGLFKNAGAMKHIDLSSRSTSTKTVVFIIDFLKGTHPDTVVFDKLSSFSWTLPDEYFVKKGVGASQTTVKYSTGFNFNFDANTRYELTKASLVEPAFPFELASGTTGDSVLANYDASEKLITISGIGTIKENKWINLARTIEGDNKSYTPLYYKPADDIIPWGWKIDSDINMVFDENANIQFDKNGFVNLDFGWFQNFGGTINFNGAVNTLNMVNMSNMFEGAEKFNDPSVADWKTNNVVNMCKMFKGAKNFNQSINNWDVSHVQNMSSLFRGATSFNDSLANWNTKNCTNMSFMFAESNFNQPINHFNVNNVKYMHFMFYRAHAFDCPIDNWQTNNLKYIIGMFYEAEAFNQSITSINTDKMVDKRYGLIKLFKNATAIKHIDLSNRSAQSRLMPANNMLDGTSPNSIKFDKLNVFSWQLPAKYEVKKGAVGSQTSEIVTAGTTYSFDENTRYELYKLPSDPNVSLNDLEKTYDGSVITGQYLIDNCVVNSANIAGSWQFEPVNFSNVGNYTVNATFTPTDSVAFKTKSLSASITINPKQLTLANPIVLAKVYDGTTAATVKYDGLTGVATGDEADVSIRLIDATFDSANADTAKPVTVNDIALKGAKSGNYNIAVPTGLSGDITQRAPMYQLPTNLTATYGDVLSSVTLPLATNGHFEFADPAHQISSVNDTTFSIVFVPNDTTNYSVAQDQVTLTVNKKMLSLENPQVQSKVYDGTTAATVKYDGLTGVVAGDEADVSIRLIDATFDSANADTAKPVTVNDIALKGAKKDNYYITMPTNLTSDISKATPKFSIPTNLHLNYGESLKSIQLPSDAGGNWQFENPNIRPVVIGANRYNLIYLPNDNNYETALVEVKVLLLDDNNGEDYEKDEKDIDNVGSDKSSASNSLDNTLQLVQQAQNLKLNETISFDTTERSADASATTEQAMPNHEVALKYGTISLKTENNQAGTIAQLALKPKPGYRVSKVELHDEAGRKVDYVIDDKGLFNLLIPKGKLSVDVRFIFVLPEEATFDDVPLDHPNVNAIEHLFAEKIMIGIADTVFDSTSALNRAMVIKILHNMTGNPQVDVTLDFEDVSVNAWYYQALQWGFKSGIAKGYNAKQFAPLKAVSKEEFLAFLYRYAMNNVIDNANDFDLSIYKDGVNIANYARVAFNWALNNKLIEKNKTGELEPKVIINRAAAAEIMERYLAVR